MQVTCDDCGATYKIPEEKLKPNVRFATCRRCGFKMSVARRELSPELKEERLSLLRGREEPDDDMVSHEDRTVISEVPELKDFNATSVQDVRASAPILPVLQQETSFVRTASAGLPEPEQVSIRRTPAPIEAVSRPVVEKPMPALEPVRAVMPEVARAASVEAVAARVDTVARVEPMLARPAAQETPAAPAPAHTESRSGLPIPLISLGGLGLVGGVGGLLTGITALTVAGVALVVVAAVGIARGSRPSSGPQAAKAA